MTASEFDSDDRFAVLTEHDLNCAGGNRDLALQRLLDEEYDTSFVAVREGDTVWTAKQDQSGEQTRDESGDVLIEWEPLAEFCL